MAGPDSGPEPGDDPRRREPEISEALAGHGLIARGWFRIAEGEAPGFGSALLVGQAGASIWPFVQAWRAVRPQAVRDPIDEWTQEVVAAVARAFGAAAAFPFQRPYLPFQRWAARAEGLRASPLGILMHPQYGLWHAYRGALLFRAAIDAPDAAPAAHPCESCVERPCLSACPAGAWSDAGFARGACMEHLHGGEGEACMTGGCLARNACPVGGQYRYPPDLQAHHQSYFRDGGAA